MIASMCNSIHHHLQQNVSGSSTNNAHKFIKSLCRPTTIIVQLNSAYISVRILLKNSHQRQLQLKRQHSVGDLIILRSTNSLRLRNRPYIALKPTSMACLSTTRS